MKQNVAWDLTSGWENHIAVLTKFLFPTHNEAKQTETLEFGAGRNLLQGHARKTRCFLLLLVLPKGFQQSIFTSEMREEKGSRVTDQLRHDSLVG